MSGNADQNADKEHTRLATPPHPPNALPRNTVAVAFTVGWFREIETTVFDPASVFLSTHDEVRTPSQFLAKEACSFYKRDLFRCHTRA